MVSSESLETLTADHFYGGLLERGYLYRTDQTSQTDRTSRASQLVHPIGCHSASPRIGGGKRPRTTGGKRGTLTSTTLVVAQAHPSATTRVE